MADTMTQSPSGSKALAGNEELTRRVTKEIQTDFSRFETDREDYQDIWQVADYMVKCAQNRTVNASERAKGANTEGAADTTTDGSDTRANVGSTIFFQQQRTLAAMGVSVQESKPVPFKYQAILNENVPYSQEEGNEIANQKNILARWTMKKDGFRLKTVEFWHQIWKYGAVPVGIFQKTVKRKVLLTKKQYVDTPEGRVLVGETEEEREIVTDNYPSLRIFPLASLYADVWRCWDDQDCILVATIRNRAQIYADVKAGFFDEAKYKKINRSHEWDGYSGRRFVEEQAENTGDVDYNPRTTGQFCQWDVFKLCPIRNGKWDDDAVPQWYWLTIIGNSPDNGVTVRFERNPDPDDEVPIRLINALPDDSDMLYHVSPAEIVRSNYSVECTLKGAAIDNICLVNEPPLMAVEGAHRITDFEFKRGQLWRVMNPDAIKEFQVRDNTQSTAALLDYVNQDTRSALFTNMPITGQEGYGARTSASEAVGARRSAMTPHLVVTRYILDQLLSWYARKSSRYWDAFGTDDQVIAISDEPRYPEIRPSQLHGEFDIEVNIVDEFHDDLVMEQRTNEMLRLVASVPILQKSIDIYELLKPLFERQRLPLAALKQTTDIDAKMRARDENRRMIENGEVIRPQQGEAHATHYAEHMGEMLRWQGLDPAVAEGDERIINAQTILQAHIDETKFLMQQDGQQTGDVAGGSGNASEGEVVGNAIAGAMRG